MKRVSPLSFWQTILRLSLAITLLILLASLLRCSAIGVILYRSVWSIPLTVYVAVLTGIFELTRRLRSGRLEKSLAVLELASLRGMHWRLMGWMTFLVIVFLIPWLKITFHFGEEARNFTQDPVLSILLYYWIVWWLVLIAAGSLKIALQTHWGGSFPTALILTGIFCEIFIRSHAVTAYPFSLSWSETSRYYYASLYLSKGIYGEYFPLSTMHPTRYLLQSLAFLVPETGLTWHRLWQFLLWVLISAGTSLALAKRVWQENRRLGLLFAGWFFLFILRVGVYYHLQVMVLLILLGVSIQRPWRSLVFVILASAWAGLSRINWIPVPAMMAITIYLLERPVSTFIDRKRNKHVPEKRKQAQAIVGYLKQPFLWTLAGLSTALTTQAAYVPLSGNADNAQAFTSSFTSDLLWNRLWPNDSFSLGVVPAILLVSGPLLLVIFYGLRQKTAYVHWIRLTGLLSMLAVLFGGGLVVSAKIGGGADLHNMDAYSVLIGIIAAYFLFGKTKQELGHTGWGKTPWPVIAVAVLIPLFFLLPALSPYHTYNKQKHQRVLEHLRKQTETFAQKGPVLFINERHLVTFKQIDVPLVPDYENVTLMEMSMSGNQPYMERFYADLENHRFAAIVAGRQNLGIMETGAFAEENNVWNSRVAPYILCYYEPLEIFQLGMGQVGFYLPRSQPACP